MLRGMVQKTSHLAGAIFAGAIAPAYAADVSLHAVTWQDNPDGKLVTVRVYDKIEDGDLDRIKHFLWLARSQQKVIVALELDSWGGDGDTGLAIADFVASKPLMKVYIGNRCWSACSYAALAALGMGNLLVGPYGEIGVHQVYTNSTHKADRAWTERAANKLRRYGAPNVVLEDMVNTSPDGLATYAAQSLEKHGATVFRSWWAWILW
jgi:hypothetical protein